MITPEWVKAIDAYLQHATAAGHSRETRTTRRNHLLHLADGVDVGPWRVTLDHLERFFSAHEWAQETRRGRRASLTSFYGWALERGHIEDNPAAGLARVAASKPNPQPVPARVYAAALLQADPRARLMARMAKELGLRRGEVARSHSSWIVEDLTGWSLRVVGKGGKVRDVPMPAGLAYELRERGAGYLFPGRDGGHLSAPYVGKIVGRLLPGIWTMHKLRHSAATEWHDICGDLAVVQDLLGHASPATTRSYVRVKQDKLRATVEAAA